MLVSSELYLMALGYRLAPEVDRGITIWRRRNRRWQLFARCESLDEARLVASAMPGSVISRDGRPDL